MSRRTSNRRQALRRHRVVAALVGAAISIAAAVGKAAPQSQPLRPEIGVPLLAAEGLVKTQHYADALLKIREADRVPDQSPDERLTIERMRIAAALGANDLDIAARAFEVLQASDRVSSAEKQRLLEAVASAHYRAGEYAKAVQWVQRYRRSGGAAPAMRTLEIQALFLVGRYAEVVRELTAEVRSAERGGVVPTENRLKLLLNAASHANDSKAAGFALETLATHYPKPEYWAELLARVRHQPGFSNRLTLDAFRFAQASGVPIEAADTMRFAQLALEAGQPAEAKQVLDAAFNAGRLGAGAKADRERRLRDLAARRLGEARKTRAADAQTALAGNDGDALLRLGLDRVYDGDTTRGVELMRQGFAKEGGLADAQQARLHLGIAYLRAGERKNALAAFRGVRGTDGRAGLARLWTLFVRAGR